MVDLIRVDDNLSVLTRAPDGPDLREMSGNRFQSIVNLRTAGEKGEVLAPEAEGEDARRPGLSYLSHPVTPDELNSDIALSISAEMEKLPGPVVVHCASGRRASLIALSHWARQNNASAKEAASKAKSAGLSINEADLEPLLEKRKP